LFHRAQYVCQRRAAGLYPRGLFLQCHDARIKEAVAYSEAVSGQVNGAGTAGFGPCGGQ
jgi:hypothetical protein